MECTTRLARTMAFTLGCMAGSAAFAQGSVQACAESYRQCTSGCKVAGFFGRQAAQVCTNSCSDTQRSCATNAAAGARQPVPAANAASAEAAGSANRPVRTAVESETPAKQAEAVPASPTAEYEPPASFEFDGPIRFAPRYATTYEQRNRPTPLSREQKGRIDDILSGESSLGRTRNNPMDPVLRSNLKAEYAALTQAGYTTLRCAYGPTVVEQGYSEEFFWLDKRPVLSNAMLELNRKYKGIDVAIVHCPPTLGEAMALAAGTQKAPSMAATLAAETAVRARTGQRFLPAVATVKNFDDARPLYRSTVLPVTSLFQDTPSAGREAWSGKPSALGEEILKLDDQGQKVLLCSYAHELAWAPGRAPSEVEAFSPASENVGSNGMSNNVLLNDIRFWLRSRPKDVSLAFFTETERMGRDKLNLVDVAATECPTRYGGALALVDGSPEALAAARNSDQHADLGSGARNSDAEDAALVGAIDAAIASLEGGGALQPDGFKQVVQTRVRPPLVQLAGSALAKVRDIPSGAAGRKRFDAWDDAFGGHVMDAVRRLFVVAKKKAMRIENSGVTLADLKSKRGEIEAESARWAEAAQAQVFTRPIYQAFMKVYEAHLAGQPVLDAAFMQRVTKDLQSANATAERNQQQRSDALRPNFVNRSEIVFGTPSEIAAYRFRTQMIDGAGNAVLGIASVKRSFAQADAEMRTFRSAFWKCYDTRCNDAAMRYAEYSLALKDKDTQYLVLPSVNAANEQALQGKTGKPSGINTIMSYLGGGSVDDGIILGCEGPARRFGAALSKRLADQGGITVPAQADTAFLGASAAPEYVEWQKCRDRMEYVFRHR